MRLDAHQHFWSYDAAHAADPNKDGGILTSSFAPTIGLAAFSVIFAPSNATSCLPASYGMSRAPSKNIISWKLREASAKLRDKNG